MKRGALWAVWILLLASVAITEAAAQPARERVDPGELEDRTVQRDPKACPQSMLDEVRKNVLNEQGKVKLCKVEGMDKPCVERYVNINCNLTLKSTDVVTRTLLMQGSTSSGVTVNCNGANIRGTH